MSTNRLLNNHPNEEVKSPSFGDLPKEIKYAEMCSHFLPNVLGLFGMTSQDAKKEVTFPKLLTSAVHAIPETYAQNDETKLAVIAMLKTHPELLFKEGMVTDHFGRKIKASPYRLLLGTGDVWALKQVHDEIIKLIKDGAAEAQKQFKAQFPNCQWPLDPKLGEEALYDKRNIEQIAQVKAQLKIIVEKISADPCTDGQATKDETTTAVAELCQIFAPKEGEVIKTGLHFPLAIMREIYSVYDAQFDPWTGAQLSFFSRAVIGAAEVALTAVDGQCCKNGLSNLNMEKGPDRRDGLFCQHPKGVPQNLAPLTDKLGRSMFVDPYNGKSCFLSSNKPGVFDWFDKKALQSRTWRGRARRGRSARAWKTHGEQKHRHMGAVMQPIFDASTYRLGDHDQQMRYVIL